MSLGYSDPALLGGTNTDHAPRVNSFRPRSCAGDQPNWRPPQCVGRWPRLAGARRWPALPPAEPRCGLGGGERGGAFLPACKALPGAPRRMPLLPWPAVTRGVHSWRTGRRRVLPQRPRPAWLFFFPGVVAGALSLSFCARAAGWHRPLLCPPGPGQESHLLWHHLLAHPPSHFRQSPQRNAILQDVGSGEPPFVLPARSLST